MRRGFLLNDILISTAIFAAVISFSLHITFVVKDMLQWSNLKIEATKVAKLKTIELREKIKNDFSFNDSSEEDVGVFKVKSKITQIDNFTKKGQVEVNFYHKNRMNLVSFLGFVTNRKESHAQSSCRPQGNDEGSYNLKNYNLGIESQNILASDIDIVGNYIYISSNSKNVSDPDIYIFLNRDKDIKVLSMLHTGPGISSLHVAGDYIYVSNTSINAQLQVINMEDKSNPFIETSYKIEGDYGSSTPIGTAVFYKNQRVVLGTDKNDLEELYYIDVANINNPRLLDKAEINHGINDIFLFEDKVYIASPHRDEIKVYKVLDNKISAFYSYNDPQSTGSGKRVNVFIDNFYLGKTKTFNHHELLIFSGITTPKLKEKFSLPASVHGLIPYGDFLYVIINTKTDAFWILKQRPNLKRVNQQAENFENRPLNFDCDRDTIGIVFENSSNLSLITIQK